MTPETLLVEGLQQIFLMFLWGFVFGINEKIGVLSLVLAAAVALVGLMVVPTSELAASMSVGIFIFKVIIGIPGFIAGWGMGEQVTTQ